MAVDSPTQPARGGDTSGGAPANAGVVAPPPLIYALPLIAGLLFQHWHPVGFVPSALAAPLGITFLVLGLIGGPAVFAFRRAGTSPEPWRATTALVTAGPYRFTRNPMYLGLTLIYVGVAVWANALWPIVLLPAVLVVMHYGVIKREERYLERIFGDEYREYRRRVRRWL